MYITDFFPFKSQPYYICYGICKGGERYLQWLSVQIFLVFCDFECQDYVFCDFECQDYVSLCYLPFCLRVLKYNQSQICSYFTARSFSGKLTGILLSKLESGNEKMKIGMLTVFKHLINAASKIQCTCTVFQTESPYIVYSAIVTHAVQKVYNGTCAIRQLSFLTSCDIPQTFMVPKSFC